MVPDFFSLVTQTKQKIQHCPFTETFTKIIQKFGIKLKK